MCGIGIGIGTCIGLVPHRHSSELIRQHSIRLQSPMPHEPGRNEMTTLNERPGPSSARSDDPPATVDQRVEPGAVAILLTVSEAAGRLRIRRTTMYELISTGAVQSVTVGRLRRIRPLDLENYVAQLRAAPVHPLPRPAA